MASEDSDQVASRFLVVHGLGDLRDLDEPVGRQVSSRADYRHAASERLEVMVLCGAQLMPLEERNDRLEQLVAPPHQELVQVLTVVIVPPVHVDPPDSEELLELADAGGAARALRDDEPMKDLVPGSVASSPRPTQLSDEADREASFSVYKANNPAGPDQPFLLIFRTVQIVTAHAMKRRASTGQILGFSSI
jgi:hypothetical protein